MIKNIPGGVYPVMITPYTDDLKIDFNGVDQLLKWYAEKGCEGIFAICLSSEIFAMNFEERLALIDFIMKHKPEGMAVVASGHVADDLNRQAYEAEKIINTGVDGYVFIANRFAKADEDDDVLLKNMNYVLDRIPECAMGIYECPTPYKRLLTPYVLSELIKDKRFKFIKDTCCNMTQIKEKLDVIKGTDFGLFNANANQFLDSMKLGAAGFSGIMANFYPEIIDDLYKCWDKDPVRAEKLQNFIGVCSCAEGQVYSCNAKYLLQKQGLDITIKSRTTDCNKFGELAKYSADQLYGLIQDFKAAMNIK